MTDPAGALNIRKHIQVRGIVQGVGFRPFVYKLARSLRLSGHVFNSSAGVTIEIEGSESEAAEQIVGDRGVCRRRGTDEIDGSVVDNDGGGGGSGLQKIHLVRVDVDVRVGGRAVILERDVSADHGAHAAAPPAVVDKAKPEAEVAAHATRAATHATDHADRETLRRKQTGQHATQPHHTDDQPECG